MATTAEAKRAAHIVEYLLFVWQMEDAVRATGFDPEVLDRMCEGMEDADAEWLLDLAHDLDHQGLRAAGHVAHAHETLTELALLHDLLSGPLEDRTYQTAYQAAEPFLRDLDARLAPGRRGRMHPAEQMMTALYGWLVLRLRREPVTLETEAALVAIKGMANALARGHVRIYQGG
jgi:hypothetical protein